MILPAELGGEARPVRVLCLSPFFAPLANAEAFCGAKAALHLAAAGAELSVISVDYAGVPKFSRDSSALWQPLAAATLAIPPHGGRPKLLSAALGLRYCSPDWARWIAAAAAASARLHRQQPFDVLYTRGIPNVAHVAGYWVHRATGLPWIANFNDPWDLEGAHLLPQFRDRRPRTLRLAISGLWLRRVMRTASVLTYPCPRLRAYHLRLGRAHGEALVFPHIGAAADPAGGPNRFDLVHAGNLGTGESTRRGATGSLLQAFRSFLDRRPAAAGSARLVLVGTRDAPTLELAERLGIGDAVACTGRLSYAQSLEHIASAAVCVLVEGPMPEGIYLPSKFADYIAARKPVIALSPPAGTIADYLPRRGVTVAPVSDCAAIEAAIRRHFDAHAAGQLAELAPDEAFAGEFDGALIARRLLGVFRRLAPAAAAS